MRKLFALLSFVIAVSAVLTYSFSRQNIYSGANMLLSEIEALSACEASAMCPNSNSMIRCNTDSGNCTSGLNSAGQTYVQCGGNTSTCN